MEVCKIGRGKIFLLLFFLPNVHGTFLVLYEDGTLREEEREVEDGEERDNGRGRQKGQER